jgi:5'/3'-nucleotidase SurE
LLLVLVAACCASAETPDRSLRILLTNDDGHDAPGLGVLRAALEADGHDVVVVAPSENQSGSSVSYTSRGKLTWHQVDPKRIAVDGTPADCIRLAVSVFLEEPVDLIVSGINFGQNVGSGTVSSGTVGAAITGASYGIPAIAVSQAVDANDLARTVQYFPDAAAMTVALVRELADWNRAPLLPSGTVLNVNHPPRKAADVEGLKLTRQGRSTLYTLVYEEQEDGSLTMDYAPNPAEETVDGADTTALAAGFVTVTPLEGSWTAEGAFDALRPLEGSRRAVSTPAPNVRTD